MSSLGLGEILVCLIPIVFITVVLVVIFSTRSRRKNAQTQSPGNAQNDTQPGLSQNVISGNGLPPGSPVASQNSLATVSLVTGILAVIIHFLFGINWSALLGIAAIIIGMISLTQINKRAEKGRNIALAGILTGFLPMVITVLMIMAVLLFHD